MKEKTFGLCVLVFVSSLGSFFCVWTSCRGEVTGSASSPAPSAEEDDPSRNRATVPFPTECKQANELPPLTGMDPQAVCAVLCGHTTVMGCGSVDTCVRGCLSMAIVEVCTHEMQQFLRCAAQSPLNYFECDETTEAPALKDGYCLKEQTAVARCMNNL